VDLNVAVNFSKVAELQIPLSSSRIFKADTESKKFGEEVIAYFPLI
jgi:hypothetical protein